MARAILHMQLSSPPASVGKDMSRDGFQYDGIASGVCFTLVPIPRVLSGVGLLVFCHD